MLWKGLVSLKHKAAFSPQDFASLEKILFSETGGFVVEVDNKNIQKVENILQSYKLKYSNIGKTTSASEIKMNGVINILLDDAKELWSNGLRNKLK